MERKVGEIFTCNGKIYKVIKGNRCAYCDIGNTCILKASIIGPCTPTTRTDKTDIVFKEINNMENNQLTIDIPEGMEIDLKNSDLVKGIIKFKQSGITYKDIENALNLEGNRTGVATDTNNVSKLSAIDKLMNIAKYYNEDWKPNWNNSDNRKYFIVYNSNNNTYIVDYNYNYIYNNICFKNKEDAIAIINNPNFRNILNTVFGA